MQITPALVKELREQTGAGVMDCKKALTEANGDIEKAKEILRQRGFDKAAKKSSRKTSEGLIGSYIHSNGKIGVLVELQCETDFVARTPQFQELLKDLCMQVAATAPVAVDRESLPEEMVKKAREEAEATAQAKAAGKPAHIIERIVNDLMEKFFAEKCLMDQPFIKDESKTIRDIVTEAISKFSENIVVRRFVRFELGEEDKDEKSADE